MLWNNRMAKFERVNTNENYNKFSAMKFVEVKTMEPLQWLLPDAML